MLLQQRASIAMDESIVLTPAHRDREVENLSQFIAASMTRARLGEMPFHHLVFDRIFPDDFYEGMLAAMPDTSDYRAMSGRSKGLDLADGTHTRVKIDLFPEYIRALPAQKRAIWHIVGRALCSQAVKQALIHGLAPALRITSTRCVCSDSVCEVGKVWVGWAVDPM